MDWTDTLNARQAGLLPGFHGHNTPHEDQTDDGTEDVERGPFAPLSEPEAAPLPADDAPPAPGW